MEKSVKQKQWLNKKINQKEKSVKWKNWLNRKIG